MTNEAADHESMLEIAVNAEAARHDLSGFWPVKAAECLLDGFGARCRNCGQTAWVGDDGLAIAYWAIAAKDN